jgi:hypothetical protein
MRLVGSAELESATSCVSSRRSNQLSYEPQKTCANWALTGTTVLKTKTLTYYPRPCQGSGSPLESVSCSTSC